MYRFDLAVIAKYLGGLGPAVAMTLTLTLITLILSTMLGVLLALARTSRSQLLRFLAGAYTEVLRNVPLIVVVFFVYFGLSQLGVRLSGRSSVLVALVANATAYMTEVIRGGLLSIPRGQVEAAAAQGMRYHQVQRYVVLPQVLRNVFAAYGNICVGILLGTSLAAVIGVHDLSYWMLDTGAASFRYMETFLVAAAVYFVLVQAVTFARVLAGRWLFGRRPA
jgi:polar amino acid transport system permease protein